jgi:hypothetical protein
VGLDGIVRKWRKCGDGGRTYNLFMDVLTNGGLTCGVLIGTFLFGSVLRDALSCIIGSVSYVVSRL